MRKRERLVKFPSVIGNIIIYVAMKFHGYFAVLAKSLVACLSFILEQSLALFFIFLIVIFLLL